MDAREPAAIVRQRVIYHGRVQGVGFRYTTASIARRHAVAGFVRNQPDGTVELVAEGAPAAVDEFLSDVSAAMQGHIESVETSDAPAGETFRTFEIRH